MTTSYLEFSGNENTVPWDTLSRSCLSFCRWMWRFYHQTGVVDAGTAYLAYKQGKCKRTVYRWLAQAEAAGAIKRDSPGSHEREIVPLAEPPKTPKKRPAPPAPLDKNVTQNVTQNVTRLSSIDAVRGNATTTQTEARASEAPQGDSAMCVSQETECSFDRPTRSRSHSAPPEEANEAKFSPLVEDLAKNGVAVPVAVHLAATEPDRVAEQLAALPYRQAKDKAAVLVASIKQSWPLPEAFKAAIARKQKQAADAQNAALRAELSKKRESARLDTKARFSGLPDSLRAELLDRAAAALRADLPAAWRIMQNRPPEVREAWIIDRAISLMGVSNA